ncbi:PREDICTED: uncharacterized protein LOC109342173 [Lupinus angustifolius]|uniref:uncharacterized protein LOC109342173 n=1 Tax=Lupinus angustifolius TaxID=3871 RepID=UPI00092E483D|nr:PREDICTED: uncharacterized protein LOC109342173 [Lupinus angustifolius]
METKDAANQMLSCFCFFLFKNNNTLLSWMPLVSLFLLFSSYLLLLLLKFGVLSILYTFLVLLFSTIVLVLYSTVSKQKAVYVDNLVQEEKEPQGEVHNSECQEKDQLGTSEDSQVGWSFQHDNSDGSISDEESLIEIELPTGQCGLQQKKRELSSPEALFSQKSIIKGFLAEFNEEENLIEIDISMGSIKYSRFEIKAA